MKITKIELIESTHTMGELTDGDLDNWVIFLREKLTEAYPEAIVIVDSTDREISARLSVETEDGWDEPDAKAEIQDVKNGLWSDWL